MLKIFLVIIRLKTQNPIQINHKVKKKKSNLSKIPIKAINKSKINKLNVWQFKINKLMHKMFKKWLFKKKNPWKNKSQNKIRKNKRAKTITKMFNKR